MLSFVTLIFGLCREASNNGNIGLIIDVEDGVEAKLNMKGKVTLNSNGFYGMAIFQNPNTNLEINVENGSTLNSCGNSPLDIYGFTASDATLTFSGDGSYTCSSKDFVGGGTVVGPTCQDCS